MNLKIGNQVKVVAPGYTYDLMEGFVEKYSGEHFKKFKRGYSPCKDDKGVIIAIEKHPHGTSMVAIVASKDHVFAISSDAIENLQPKMIKAAEKPFDWSAFKSGKVAVHCDTEEKAREFLKECDEQGIIWNSGGMASSHTYFTTYKSETCYSCNNDYLCFCGKNYYLERTEVIDYIPSKPTVKEVKRPAKVGEWIRVTHKGSWHGNQYNIGEIYQIDAMTYSNAYYHENLSDELCFDDSEYVVLESYQPEDKPSKAPLSEYTMKEILTEALRRCENE